MALLGVGDGEGRALGDLGGERPGFGFDIGGEAVDEADPQGLLGLDPAGGEDHLLRRRRRPRSATRSLRPSSG